MHLTLAWVGPTTFETVKTAERAILLRRERPSAVRRRGGKELRPSSGEYGKARLRCDGTREGEA
ncbi:MAG: hypothetical protein ACC651_02805 [Candidatus Scalindua sp.]